MGVSNVNERTPDALKIKFPEVFGTIEDTSIKVWSLFGTGKDNVCRLTQFVIQASHWKEHVIHIFRAMQE